MIKSTHSPSLQHRTRHGSRPRRLLLYAHHNRWGSLAEYVIYLLQRVRKLYSRIVFISTSPLSQDSYALLQGVCDAVYQRQYDESPFLAWKEALYAEGFNTFPEYDSITLMNSSCIGPLFPLENTYRSMESQSLDLWGMTPATVAPPRRRHATSENICASALQSYFLCFRKSAVLSSAFLDFWEVLREEKTTARTTLEYEALLADMMCSAGLKSGSVYDTGNSARKSSDRAPATPQEILERRIPFLKIEAFFSRIPPENAFLLTWIKRHCRYPWRILEKYLRTYFSPETSLQVVDHNLNGKERCKKASNDLRVALHVHAFYPDILHQILRKFRPGGSIQPDIFLTTDSPSKATEIRHILHKNFPYLHLCETFVFENRGRDVYPWLKIAPLLESYDFVGHLHTKKRGGVMGCIWLEEVLDCLLGRLGQIKSAFATKPQLGIVIPDMPSLFKFSSNRPKFFYDLNRKSQLARIWKRLGCQRQLDFFVMKTLVFPYGNMFWYRPLALKKLWRHHWDLADIPPEPIPDDGTLLHILERLPVYVAWDEGYDFCIAPPTVNKAMGFQYDLALCDYKAENLLSSIIQLGRMRMLGRGTK